MVLLCINLTKLNHLAVSFDESQLLTSTLLSTLSRQNACLVIISLESMLNYNVKLEQYFFLYSTRLLFLYILNQKILHHLSKTTIKNYVTPENHFSLNAFNSIVQKPSPINRKLSIIFS